MINIEKNNSSKKDEVAWIPGFVLAAVLFIAYWPGYHFGRGELVEFLDNGWPLVGVNLIPFILLILGIYFSKREKARGVKPGSILSVALAGFILGVFLGASTVF